MKYFEIFPLLLVVCLISAVNLQGSGNVTLQRKRLFPVMRIIDGADATEDEFPYMVGLLFVKTVGSSFCGGALIDHKWVLTAAHCTIGAQSVMVYLGSIIRRLGRVEYDLPNTNIVAHNFVDGVHTDDIAVVHIPHVDYSHAIHKIPLPRNTPLRPSYATQQAITMGWGFITPHRKLAASILQHITLVIITNSKCKESYGSTRIYDGKICTAGIRNRGPCKGDSGGPLVSLIDGHLIGIYSFGDTDACANGYPEAFTRVHDYLGWIHIKTGIPI